MSLSLGISVGNKIIKYAKLSLDSQKNITVETQGIKFYSDDKTKVIQEIIAETNSKDIPMAINLQNENYDSISVLNKLSKSDITKVVDVEFEELCEKRGSSFKLFEKRYIMADEVAGSDMVRSVIVSATKNELQEYKEISGANVTNVLPLPIVLTNLIPPAVKNYILIDFENGTNVLSVQNGKIQKLTQISIGLSTILDKLSYELNSYTKAYEMCKSVNVYGEGSTNIVPEVERVIEPIIQDIIHRIEAQVIEHRNAINIIYVTGIGTMFSNIDLLLEEYFGVKVELLKPGFLEQSSMMRNYNEILEVNSAISLAFENYTGMHKELNFAVKKGISAMFQDAFKKSPKENKIREPKQKGVKTKKEPKEKGPKAAIPIANNDIDKINNILAKSNAVIASALLVYAGVGVAMDYQVKNNQTAITKVVNEVNGTTKNVESDISYVNTSINQYKTITDYVSTTLDKIEKNEISKFTTYNVAKFLQEVMNIIPKNIELVSIASNDNKHVTVTAKSPTYSELGYFISKMKLDGILTNIKVQKIENSDMVKIEIGGDLP